jgi:hypothetical protein
MLCFTGNAAFFYYDDSMAKGEERLTFSRRVLPRGDLTGWLRPCRNAKPVGSAAEINILRKNTDRLEIVPLKHIRCDLLYSIS